ncbi:MAG: aldo/keto reductase [Gammaproteobacteria bacterium]
MSVERTELRPGYTISRVIRGAWQLAGGHGQVERARALADMRSFVDAGITTFDCADIYTGVETMIGEFAHGARAGSRTGFEIHTKLVPDLDALATCRPADLERIVDRSLLRLRVERLDLVQCFWWDLGLGDAVGTLASLGELQRKGKIRHVGVTNFDGPGIAALLEAGLDVVSAQVQYSLLDARARGDFTTWCAEHDIKLLCYGVLAGGFLTEAWLGQPDPGFAFENRSLTKYRLVIEEFGGWTLFQSLLEVTQAVADRHGVDIGAVAARYVLDLPQVAAVIIGARYAHHLPSTLQIFDFALDDEDRAALQAVLALRRGPRGPVYGLESDRSGPHGAIMKYNLNSEAPDAGGAHAGTASAGIAK